MSNLILLAFIFLGTPAKASSDEVFDPSVVYRCDALTSCGSGDGSNVQTSLKENIGLSIPTLTAPTKALPARPAKIKQVIQRIRERAPTQDNYQRPGQGQTASPTADNQNEENSSNNRSGSGYPSFKPASASSQGQMGQSPGGRPQAPKGTFNGSPIIDDSQPEEIAHKPGSTGDSLNGAQAAVEAARNMEVGSGDNDSGGTSRGVNGSNLPAGSTAGFDGANKRKTASAPVDSYLESLKDMAAGLLDKGFMGLSGKKSRGRNKGKKYAVLGANGKKGAMGAALDINSIRNSFNKNLQRRSLASQLEFSGANSFLFGKMCQHYDNYARNHRIPNQRSGCPKD